MELDFSESLTQEECYLWDDLPVCGCGDADSVLRLFRTFLAVLPSEGSDSDFDDLKGLFDEDERLAWLVLYVLDDRGFIEHGSTVRWSWRTDKGDQLLALLDRYLLSEADF